MAKRIVEINPNAIYLSSWAPTNWLSELQRGGELGRELEGNQIILIPPTMENEDGETTRKLQGKLEDFNANIVAVNRFIYSYRHDFDFEAYFRKIELNEKANRHLPQYLQNNSGALGYPLTKEALDSLADITKESAKEFGSDGVEKLSDPKL